MERRCSQIHVFKRIKEMIEKHGNSNLKEIGLTIGQGSILLYISEQGQASMKEIEKVFHVSQPTIVGIIARLIKSGLVESFGVASDKRVKIVKLTHYGQQRVNEIGVAMKKTEDTLFSALTEDEKDIFGTLLAKIGNSLE